MANNSNGWKGLDREISQFMQEEVYRFRFEYTKIAIDKVVEFSPVLKGTFVLNNIVSVGMPDFTVNENKVAGTNSLPDYLLADLGGNDDFARGEARSKMMKKLPKTKKTSYLPIYIQNNIFYSPKVETLGWKYTDPYETYQKAFDYLEGNLK